MMKTTKEITTQKTLIQEILNLVRIPIIIGLVLTPVRFTLELLGLPENFIFFIGLLWLTLGLSIYWGIKHHHKKQFLILLLLSLTVFSSISRVPVALAWWVDTNWELNTHYGFFFDNFEQVLLNQIVFGSIIQIIPGFILGSITFAIMRHKITMRLKNNTVKHG